ncbi:MAG: nitrogen regulation protein NR(I) [Gammaproteobacteria bacterium]|nr:nitrogen regulation protein NR(I) [Gammaproteobacteria bacterium]
MNTPERVWVIDDDRSIRWVLERALRHEGMQVTSFESGSGVLERMARERPDVVISDIRMPDLDGLELLSRVTARFPEVPVIIMTAYSDLDSAVSAYEGGAFEYLPKPFDVDDAVELVRRAAARRNAGAEESGGTSDGALEGLEIIGSAPAMQEVFRAIGRLARSSVTVLITGQSGTGKELVAHALHRHSPRKEYPFIALNTAAIPRDLLESELFGHERGAFTGAAAQRRGRFEQAHEGTLFLDEIGDMPAELQTRLLRVLADGEFYRVGGATPIRVDVRVIAATHQNLEQRVKDGVFREDLYHRLNVIRIHVPPLKERREDIPGLAARFLDSAAEELGVEPKRLSAETESYLSCLDWPGNVRQLENTCRWLTVMASAEVIVPGDLPPELRGQEAETEREEDWEENLTRWCERHISLGDSALRDEAVPRFERTLLKVALRHTHGHRQAAARLLGWGRNTLTRKLKELQLDEL